MLNPPRLPVEASEVGRSPVWWSRWLVAVDCPSGPRSIRRVYVLCCGWVSGPLRHGPKRSGKRPGMGVVDRTGGHHMDKEGNG